MEVNGYTLRTTFLQDFQIADIFGESAIRDTYKRASEEWNTNTEYFTELVMVLNWMCWGHHAKGHEKLSVLYEKLYYKAHNYALSHFEGADLEYYLTTTD